MPAICFSFSVILVPNASSTSIFAFANRNQGILHLLLDRQVEFAFGVVQLALLAEHVGLRSLRLRKLLVVGGKQLRQVGELLVALFEIGGKESACPLRFGLDDSSAFGPQPCRYLIVDGVAGLLQLVLLSFELSLPLREATSFSAS
jgi:hypothetical protein